MERIEQAIVERVTGSRAIVRLASGRCVPVAFDEAPAQGDEVAVDIETRVIITPHDA